MKTISKSLFLMLLIVFLGCKSNKVYTTKKMISQYRFDTLKLNPHLPIAYQNLSETCWAFSMTSFFESEIIRKTNRQIDLSEMFIVRNAYLQKAHSHILRHGQQPFIEGAMNPDAVEAIIDFGIMPQTTYTGLTNGDKFHDHSILYNDLLKILPKYTQKGIFKSNWQIEVMNILDKNMGKTPKEFIYDSRSFSPISFMESLSLKAKDLIHITSFNHKPFYENVMLDVQWNFLNKPFYNLPIDEFIENIDYAINNGFTVAVELDVSEKTYSGEYGIAVIPKSIADSSMILIKPLEEAIVSQSLRQQEFENFNTINDHNQHIIGKVKDQNGKVYYVAKNSWKDWGREGYIYISEAYIKLKVLYYTMNKSGLKQKYIGF